MFIVVIGVIMVIEVIEVIMGRFSQRKFVKTM
jgi:hypothetical protein